VGDYGVRRPAFQGRLWLPDRRGRAPGLDGSRQERRSNRAREVFGEAKIKRNLDRRRSWAARYLGNVGTTSGRREVSDRPTQQVSERALRSKNGGREAPGADKGVGGDQLRLTSQTSRPNGKKAHPRI
jgi:hypothetical protein